jgi:hypothetical protein
MTERPFTKNSFGQESVNNTIFGFNSNFSTEVPFFTRLVNKLPNIDTDVPSNLSVRGEVAFFEILQKRISLKENPRFMWMISKVHNPLLICVRHMLGPWHDTDRNALVPMISMLI